MAKQMLFDEFHLTVYAAPRLPESEYAAIKKVLDGNRFQRDLACAVRAVLRRYPVLRRVRVRLSR